MLNLAKSSLIATLCVVASHSAVAATTSISGGNWVGGAWTNGEPGIGDDAVITAGATVNHNNVSAQVWSGTLTLEAGAILTIAENGPTNEDYLPFDGATTIFMADGSRIRDNWTNDTVASNIVVAGTAGLAANNNTANNRNHIFSGVISGDTWTHSGRNHTGYTYTNTNSFSAYIADSQDRHAMSFDAVGALSGDLTVNAAGNGRSGVVRFGVDNAVASGVSMDLNGAGWNASTGGFGPYSFYSGSSYNIDLNGTDQTVSGLTVNGLVIDAGVYALGDPDTAWLGDRAGGGTLTVIPEPSSLALLGLGGLLIARRRRG